MNTRSNNPEPKASTDGTSCLLVESRRSNSPPSKGPTDSDGSNHRSVFSKRLKLVLALLGAALCADAAWLAYFLIFRQDHYFPGNYEDAVVPVMIGAIFGLLLGVATILLLGVLYWTRSKNRRIP